MHNYVGNTTDTCKIQQFPKVLVGACVVRDEKRNIRFPQDSLRSLDSLGSKLPDVIKSRCIDDKNRPERQKLHGLLYRVRGRALVVGNYGDLLSGERVHEAGLAGVPLPEKSYMGPLPGWGLIHLCHYGLPLLFLSALYCGNFTMKKALIYYNAFVIIN